MKGNEITPKAILYVTINITFLKILVKDSLEKCELIFNHIEIIIL